MFNLDTHSSHSDSQLMKLGKTSIWMHLYEVSDKCYRSFSIHPTLYQSQIHSCSQNVLALLGSTYDISVISLLLLYGNTPFSALYF